MKSRLRPVPGEAAAPDPASTLCLALADALYDGVTKDQQLFEWFRDLDMATPAQLERVDHLLYEIALYIKCRRDGVDYLEFQKARRKAPAIETVRKELKLELIMAAGKCRVCSSTHYLEVDHVVPVTRGGGHDRSNLQVLCRGCNAKKHTKTMDEWLGKGWEARLA